MTTLGDIDLTDLDNFANGFPHDQPVEWTRSNRHTGIRHLFVRMGRR
ncbi:MAG: hypothetical protein ACYDH6_15985 [Acidimicrobiales bacterium]